ncbi:MAG: hypothetical protein GXX94_06285, partial [Chloroflexi bacterium]|nr:hypothetical protein [Chloroflexota bacterium]
MKLTAVQQAVWRAIARALLGLCVLLCAGCEQVFVPLRQAPAPERSGGDLSSLLRMTVGWGAEPLAEDLLAAYASYRPGVRVQPNTMSNASALQALGSGAADVAFVAAKDDERLLELVRTVTGSSAAAVQHVAIAQDGVALVVPRRSDLSQIDIQGLRELFSGEITDWSALDCEGGLPLALVQTTGSTARQVFDEAVMDGEDVWSSVLVLPNDAGILDRVVLEPQSVGYAGAASVSGRDVRVVAVDRMLPTT